MATVEVTKEDLREIKEMLAGLATKEELTEHFQHLEGQIGDLQRDVKDIKDHLVL